MTHAPARRVPAAAGIHGFTLVELLVAMAIGLVVALAVAGTGATLGRQFRMLGSSVSAQSSAQIALGLIDNAGRSAGAGLFSSGQLMCPTLNAWKDGAVKANGDILMPARIADGGSASASDTLVFTASSASGALSGIPLVDRMASAGASIVVSNAGLIQANDLALVAAPGSGQPCTLFQVTAAPTTGTACAGNATSCKTLARTGGSTGYNPPSPAAAFTTAPVYGFATDTGVVPAVYGPAVVSRFGTEFRQNAFAVMCGALVQYNAFTDAPACTGSLSFSGGASALVTDVVLMHAQYGLSASAASDIVTQWADATGAWAAPGAAAVGRIKAIRVVVVTRAREFDVGSVTAATCTNGAGVVNTGPCSFEDASAPVIDVSAAAVPAGRSWRNYRYRVHKAVIPLRNVIWSS
jgi:type IV pilus assembly protein PilW